MWTDGEQSIFLGFFLLLVVSGSLQTALAGDVRVEGVSCDRQRLNLCRACGTPDLLDKCCLDDSTYLMCLKDVGFVSPEASFWQQEPETEEDQSQEEQEEEKRAKFFLGKRAKYFLGKRVRNNFLGKRDADFDLDDEYSEDKRGRSPFLGKRARLPFLGKRAKYFLGKRDDETQGYDLEDDYSEEAADKRAKYFLGKRAKYFLGKRADNWENFWKRAKYFLGKRSDGKRQKYFLGKRSVDAVQQQQQQEAEHQQKTTTQ